MLTARGIGDTPRVTASANAPKKILGWIKAVGVLRNTRHRGRDRVDWIFTFAAATLKLIE